MTWLTYLNENKNIIIIAMSGAMLADCIVLFAFRRYFKNSVSPGSETLDILRADIANLRSEVLTLKSIVEEISGANFKISHNAINENGEVQYYLRPKGFWGSSASALSLSSDASYFDAVDDWFDRRAAGDASAYEGDGYYKLISEADAFLEQQNGASAYNILKEVCENDLIASSNSEVLWRLAKACKVYANTFEKNDPTRRRIIFEGRKYAVKATELNVSLFEPLRWAAIMTGLSTDYVSMKDKIRLGGEFKQYLDKAIAIQPSEYSLLHMRGRYSYTVANLSWLEKKAASALFGAAPQATIEEAIDDLLAVERLKPGTWIDNLLFLAKCYIVKKEDRNVLKYLTMAKDLQPIDDGEVESLREVHSLLEKYQK